MLLWFFSIFFQETIPRTEPVHLLDGNILLIKAVVIVTIATPATPDAGKHKLKIVNNDVLDSVLPANPYAKGGIVTKPTHALIGEGGMNEAVVPLPNGRSIPVDLGKNKGGGVTTNITVNVDQGGNTSTETDGDQANKLANAIDGAVKRVIMDERRVGGLLYNGRR